ncbi:DNA repair and recombination protein RadB [uncultured Methanosphaera sp.]|uniref:DNA repair and recombination protein RadB n=1 Tax=uncultured Methanosphaera sp. TaxID=262501 RepID=UPI002804B5FA|nr:DNA repair and recombination protein RadB [uncultured Methanosphaera sp.]
MKTLSDLKKATLIPTNSSFDILLGGGIEKGCVTQFYGPPGCGKTNIALKILYEATKDGKKAIYMDTEGGISLERIEQIAGLDFDKIVNNIYLLEPKTFDEQFLQIKQIKEVLENDSDIDILIIDSIVALYRIEDGDPTEINKRLGKLMSDLLILSREYDIAVVITNQIYSPFDSDDLIVEPIGGTVLKYWSKVIVEIQKDLISNMRSATLKRHKTKPADSVINFEIVDMGIT